MINTEVQIFTSLVERVNEIYKKEQKSTIDLTSPTLNASKDALAFFVEAWKKQEPILWEGLLKRFITDLNGTAKEINQRLQTTIDNLYLTTLNSLQPHTNNYLALVRLRSSLGDTSYGGICRNLLPEWYLTNFRQPG